MFALGYLKPYRRPIAGLGSVQLPVVGASDCRFRLRLIAALLPRLFETHRPAKLLLAARPNCYLKTGQLPIPASADAPSEASNQADPSRQQILHHPLLERAGLGEASFEGGEFGVHVGENGGDGGLFVE